MHWHREVGRGGSLCLEVSENHRDMALRDIVSMGQN